MSATNRFSRYKNRKVLSVFIGIYSWCILTIEAPERNQKRSNIEGSLGIEGLIFQGALKEEKKAERKKLPADSYEISLAR